MINIDKPSTSTGAVPIPPLFLFYDFMTYFPLCSPLAGTINARFSAFELCSMRGTWKEDVKGPEHSSPWSNFQPRQVLRSGILSGKNNRNHLRLKARALSQKHTKSRDETYASEDPILDSDPWTSKINIIANLAHEKMRSQKGNDPLPNPIFSGLWPFSHFFWTQVVQKLFTSTTTKFGQRQNASQLDVISFRFHSFNIGKNRPRGVHSMKSKKRFSGNVYACLGSVQWEQMISFSKGKKRLPSWEPTYPIKNHFWRWFSFSPGVIC